MHKIKVRSDRYNQHKKHREEMMMDMMGEPETVPVDLYGKQVFTSKDEGNVAKAGEDIREFYDLTGDAGLS